MGVGTPQYRPQIVGSPEEKDPNKVPLISETPVSSDPFRCSLHAGS